MRKVRLTILIAYGIKVIVRTRFMADFMFVQPRDQRFDIVLNHAVEVDQLGVVVVKRRVLRRQRKKERPAADKGFVVGVKAFGFLL